MALVAGLIVNDEKGSFLLKTYLRLLCSYMSGTFRVVSRASDVVRPV